MQDTKQLLEEIGRMKKEQSAAILAHNYQTGDIQDIADFVGDSLELSRAAASLDCDVIVFCGVDFMAETAAILSPDKKVLLPAPDARCPMAEMITAADVRVLRERYPDAAVVCYVNTTAEVKAESDICCTSSNAIKVVNSLEEDRVIFLPDRNLGRYVARYSGKEILPWDGFCIVHDEITRGAVLEARNLHPGAEVIVHPECRPEVIDCADHVASTSGIIREVCSSPAREFIIGTEVGILHRTKKECPDKTCYPLSTGALCHNMKKTTLAKVHASLERLEPQIVVPEDIAARARTAIGRMLRV
ncbi:MAG: quinolinate synthase NadA [Methanoregulaceae archaeon]